MNWTFTIIYNNVTPVNHLSDSGDDHPKSSMMNCGHTNHNIQPFSNIKKTYPEWKIKQTKKGVATLSSSWRIIPGWLVSG